ncbi:MAG: DUF2752 domain-containing protein [Bacteroidetes bacterium]|nr:DUF2752 domain-containing protein [Bacteroidota bacterium]MBV6459959.1 hypothetical protein [Flavobacteriales bacterium]WKZ76396.1 MAG: DUF2752 domain-containing protein [Vicingaceae bacterium]MCL4816317.1 DUF2752 domain-containing protein [Flavobacteriales bacterium]NOG95355.1 DUF2752 domain-containing protein [Bacteroidota bacterium]
MNKITHWLDEHLLPCFYKQYFGIDCPGCGMQRAFIYLLKGNISESIQLYPALIPMLLMFFYLALHLTFKFSKGAKILTFMFIFNCSLIIINYIYKIFTHGIY